MPGLIMSVHAWGDCSGKRFVVYNTEKLGQCMNYILYEAALHGPAVYFLDSIDVQSEVQPLAGFGITSHWEFLLWMLWNMQQDQLFDTDLFLFSGHDIGQCCEQPLRQHRHRRQMLVWDLFLYWHQLIVAKWHHGHASGAGKLLDSSKP